MGTGFQTQFSFSLKPELLHNQIGENTWLIIQGSLKTRICMLSKGVEQLAGLVPLLTGQGNEVEKN